MSSNLGAQITGAFEAAGLRRTSQRCAVMQYLVEQPVHASAEEIFRAVNALDPRASRATVYNSLSALERAGLVRRLSAGSGHSRYDAVLDRHYHFVCEQCGAIEDLAWFPISGVDEGAARGSRTVHSYELTLRGICERCGASD